MEKQPFVPSKPTSVTQKFGLEDLSVASLDIYAQQNQTTHDLTQALLDLPQEESAKKEALMWALINSASMEQSMVIYNELDELLDGEAEIFERSRQIVWRRGFSRNVAEAVETYEYLKANRNVRPVEIEDCSSVEMARAKFALYNRLIGGRIEEFQKERKVALMHLADDYTILAQPGYWEAIGGISLYVASNDNLSEELVQVAGKLHKETQIMTIQGGKNKSTELEFLRGQIGIHPANLILLLFLKLGDLSYNKSIEIAGSANRKYNAQGINSNLYDIPRNYFSLKKDDSGKYCFDDKKARLILSKFAKNSITQECFEKLDDIVLPEVGSRFQKEHEDKVSKLGEILLRPTYL